MSIEHELSPARLARLWEIRDGAHKGQTPAWLRNALVDTLDMIDEMVAKRALGRDAVDIVRELVAAKEAERFVADDEREPLTDGTGCDV